jgi:hypothetical protein
VRIVCTYGSNLIEVGALGTVCSCEKKKGENGRYRYIWGRMVELVNLLGSLPVFKLP